MSEANIRQIKDHYNISGGEAMLAKKAYMVGKWSAVRILLVSLGNEIAIKEDREITNNLILQDKTLRGQEWQDELEDSDQ